MSWGDVKLSSLLDAGDYIRKRELGAQQDMPHVSICAGHYEYNSCYN